MRAADDVARGQFLARVEARHEPPPETRGDFQVAAFAAHRLGDQEVLDLQV
jgi:hypothetical protein